MWRKKVDDDNSFLLGWQNTLSNHAHERNENWPETYQKQLEINGKKTLIKQNLKMSIENLEMKPNMEQKKEDIKRLCETVLQMCDDLEEKQTNLTSKRNKVIEALDETLESRNKESEAILKSFLESEINEDEFVDAFISVRASFHEMDLKREKLKELLNKREMFSSTLCSLVRPL